jgi:hypothetical protein
MTALPSPEDFTEIVAGWTGEKKAVFLDHLAQNGNVRGACARVGMSREAAYRLRRRDADFARGWGAAMVLANHAGTELLASCATEGTEHRVYFHGELVDTTGGSMRACCWPTWAGSTRRPATSAPRPTLRGSTSCWR